MIDLAAWRWIMGIKEGDLRLSRRSAGRSARSTNLIKAQIVGDILARVPSGERVQPERQVLKDAAKDKSSTSGQIVTHTTDKTMILYGTSSGYHYRRRWTYIPCGRSP